MGWAGWRAGQDGAWIGIPSLPASLRGRLTSLFERLAEVRLGEDVDVREFEPDHGLERDERRGNELEGVRAVRRVDEVDGG